MDAPESVSEPEGWKSLVTCLEELKLVTRRYSKKQLKWVRNRFLGSDMREVPLVYPLDTTDISKWEESVAHPAIETIESFIDNRPVKLKPLDKLRRLAEGFDEEKTFHCPGMRKKQLKNLNFINLSILLDCDRVFIGEFQWNLHQKSNRHKRTILSKKKKEKLSKAEK